MRKSYVMVYTSALAATHTALTDILDQYDPQGDWNMSVENCLFFTSLLSAQELAQMFEERLGVGPGKLYLITEASANKQGRLPDRGWRVLNNPHNPRGT